MNRYSASAVKFSFWFSEFAETINLAAKEPNRAELRAYIEANNPYSAVSPSRLKTTTIVVMRRVEAISPGLRELFSQLDPVNQKMVNLISIMNTESLTYSFMYEVFRQELVLGDRRIEPYEVTAFFNKLSLEYPQVAKWTDQTVSRLQSTLRNYLRSAGLVKNDGDDLVVQSYLVDPRLIDQLRADNKPDYIAIFTGRV
ncbi:DUF1819 family protein [Schleiferilactobacillus shenzhenensis]|uniref:DUF1819 family protein n=1 Tax=Schleiferilactobacillus shenzhenensis TaxID=1231337 RepID=UPI00041C2087|nr:DUF1819 family protein [Schleiferilactobacillus shenzhenensis]